MIKIGLIGAGVMGKTHLSCYGALVGEEYKVTAIADLVPGNAEECALPFGAKAYTDGEELLREADVDVVDICVPTYLHARFALAAMAAGHDVFVEKPVCRTMDEARELIAMQKKTGAKVAVGQCLRFWPEYTYLKQIIEDKTYGELRTGSFTRLGSRPSGWENWYGDHKKSGGAALDLHIHDADFMRWLFGEPDGVSGSAVYMHGSPDHVNSVFAYGDKSFSLEGGWVEPAGWKFYMGYRFMFDKAIVEYDGRLKPSMTVYTDAGTEHPEPDAAFRAEKDNGGNISHLAAYYNELRYFLECVRDGKTPQVATLEEGAKTVELVFRELAAFVRG